MQEARKGKIHRGKRKNVDLKEKVSQKREETTAMKTSLKP